MKRPHGCILAFVALLWLGPALALDRGRPPEPAIASQNAQATDAGLEILAQGGNAFDAAVAVSATLGLVEPQSSGLGGGGFMVVYDRKSNTTTTFDGRETAPATATADYFTVDGQNLGFVQAIQSGKSVGVPGAIALYKAAHEKYGKLIRLTGAKIE